MRRRRLTPYLLLTALVLGSSMGIGLGLSEAPASSPSANQGAGCPLGRAFATAGLKFRYPSCWTSKSYTEIATFFTSVVDLSDQTMHNPCHQLSTSTICGSPIDDLLPGHVLVRWFENGEPGWTLAKAPGRLITVAGRPAREAVTRLRPMVREGVGIGADETISVAISIPGRSDDWISMTAYLRSPGDRHAASEVSHMLATVTISRS